MTQSFSRFFLHFRDLLQEARFSELSQQFALPTVIFFAGRPNILRGYAAVENALELYWTDRLAQIDLQLHPVVAVEPLNQRKRTPVQIDWVFTNSAGTEVGRSRVRYFLVMQDNAPRIEMIEFLELARLPQRASVPLRATKH